MEVILLENVSNLGYKNDIVNVKNGYGLNYLIPNGYAKIATPSAKKMLAENLKQQAKKLEAQKVAAQQQADALKDVSLVIKAKTGEKDTIYGSVTTMQIADAFQEKGISIDRKSISLHESVKKLGDYVATVHFHKEVSVDVPFSVVAE